MEVTDPARFRRPQNLPTPLSRHKDCAIMSTGVLDVTRLGSSVKLRQKWLETKIYWWLVLNASDNDSL